MSGLLGKPNVKWHPAHRSDTGVVSEHNLAAQFLARAFAGKDQSNLGRSLPPAQRHQEI